MAPLAMPVASALLARDDAGDVLFTEAVSGQTDLLAYVLPTRYHPLWNEAVGRLYQNLAHNRVYVPFLGYTTIALALYGALRRWRSARFWLLTAIVYLALALGPQLRINGQLYPGIPMPYRLVGDLFVVRAVRVPNRFNLLLGLPVAVLVSLGVATLTHRRSWKKAILLTAVLAALVLREYSLVPYHTERPVTPEWYSRLAQEPDQFAVLDLPIGLQTYNKRYMFYQITHRKPLVEGKIARPPREAFAFLERSPFLSQLHDANVMDPNLTNVSSQLEVLAEANIRYVIMHKEFASSEQLLSWRNWMTFAPVYEDEALVVYRTEPQWHRDFAFSHTLTEQIGLIQVSTSPRKTVQGAVVRVDARWGSSGVPDEDYDVCLSLIEVSGEATQLQCMPLSPGWPPSRWKAGEVVRDSYVLRLPSSLAPGDYLLAMMLVNSGGGPPTGQRADIESLRVDPFRPGHALESIFGDVIRLRGYDLRQSHDALSLTLYWRALREMNTSYKVFVHLTNPSSGDIVAQVDTVPRDWTYPTDRWLQGEMVRDTVQLPLEGVSSGRYVLTVGCYDPMTGRRLPAFKPGGERYPADAVSMMSLTIE
jgi:hypothetical protein